MSRMMAEFEQAILKKTQSLTNQTDFEQHIDYFKKMQMHLFAIRIRLISKTTKSRLWHKFGEYVEYTWLSNKYNSKDD
jgi:hypothetical protein